MNFTRVYEVVFEHFTERHFVKTFAKKHKGAWEATLSFVKEEFRFFDVLFNKSIAETIVDSGNVKICKTEFKISGTQESRHGSGNRCIVAIHKNIKVPRGKPTGYCRSSLRSRSIVPIFRLRSDAVYESTRPRAPR